MEEEEMKNITEKKYLGDIISCDGKKYKNIKEKTNKALGNVIKIIPTLNKRPYGRHIFNAFKLMRESHILGGMLTNAERWINVTKQKLNDLEKPDIILQRKALSVTLNPKKNSFKLS